MKIKESNGKHKGETIYCPFSDWDCPYCSENNVCYINDPIEDCEDFMACFDSWEEWEEP